MEALKSKMSERKVVIPGEVIVSGNEYLPGDFTEKRNEDIVALRFGVAEESNNLVRIIPISGAYHPRRGNVVIGNVANIIGNGWFIDIDTPENAFLSLSEVPRYVNRGELNEVMDMGDIIVAKIVNIDNRGIDLTLRFQGLGKVEGGMKEGSMINLIKDETKCNITVGQNGIIWIKGEKVEDELLAKKAITFVTENFFTEGLTEEMKKWFTEQEIQTSPGETARKEEKV